LKIAIAWRGSAEVTKIKKGIYNTIDTFLSNISNFIRPLPAEF
jgi:hypothetical protein